MSLPTFTLAYYFLTESSSHQICLGKINYTDGNGATYNSGLNVNNASNTWFNLSTTNSPCFEQIPGTLFFPSVANAPVSLNEWHCIVNTFENGNEKIYFDGQLVSNEILPFTTGKYCTNTDFLIGSWWSGDIRPFKGKLDEVRVYNRAINENEVRALCDTRIASTPYTINEYTEVLDVDPCKNTLIVNDASRFNIGDTVLLIQMKGALIDSANTANFGQIRDYKNSGNYEFNIIKDKNGNNLNLKNTITRQYDVPNGKVQLVRVPYFDNYTVPAATTLTCPPWNGTIGGVLALNVKETLNLYGDIDASGKGFRGGASPNTGVTTLFCFYNDYNYPSGNLGASEKGESISSIGSDIAWGKGAPSNGGGGGLGHNSGGGGGANGGMGGLGGYQLLPCGNSPYDNRGLGGHALSYDNTQNKIFLGGGGGSGHVDNAGGSNMEGGNGGGIIIIQSNYINSNGFKISSNGNNATQCNFTSFTDCHDGSGGGGSGGTILINNNNYLGTLQLNANGGKGGDIVVYNPSVGADKIGPGGGGGGGIIWLNSATAPSDVTRNLNLGINGVIVPNNNDPWGATPGQAGVSLLNLHIPFPTIPFKPNIDSVRIKDSLLSCDSFNFKGIGYVNTNPVTGWQWYLGDGAIAATQNTTHTYTPDSYTVKLIATDINGCKDSTTKNIIASSLFIDAGPNNTICAGNSTVLQGIETGATQYSWTPAIYLNDATILNPLATLPVTTQFYLTATNTAGCSGKDSVLIAVHMVSNFSVSPSMDICPGKSINLIASGGDIYSWEPSGSVNNPGISNPIASPQSTTTYTVQITDTICSISSILSTDVVVFPTPVVKASKSNDVDCSIASSQLSATGATQYQWTPAVSLSNPLIPNPVASPRTPTQYIVKGTNTEGCSNTDSILVDVKAINKGLYLMPSAFTPNNDGLNDCYSAKTWGFISDFEFSIFNRWGERVFHTTNPTQCWDGTYKGVQQKADVYVYIIRAKSLCESSIFRKGTFALIR
ncbi:MAG: gliding motility-associated C-terminal domain-containing protein [Bacteroidota bacterium]